MTKDIINVIEEEMKRYSSRSEYLNNFFLNLPDARCKHGGYYQDLAVVLGCMDLNQIETGADPEEEKQRGASELYLNQKRRDFFTTIDQVLVESGIAIDEVQRLQKEGGKDKIKELHELVFPAYIRLREMGYSHRDLMT